MAHRVINGQPFTITPAFRAIYESQHPRIILRKAAQVFASEWMVNVALFVPDTGQGGRGNSLYVFPTAEQGDDFSRARIDKAIEESAHLSERTDNPKNVRQKRIGRGYLYVRGAQRRNQIISVDADCVCCDEIAEYTPGTIDTVERRLGSSLLNWIRVGSTPRYPADEAGVTWDLSTQSVYEVRCSHCGTWQHLDIETHLNPETALVQCRHCQSDLGQDRLGEGRWMAQQPGRDWQGYQLTKLLSPRANLRALADKYRKVLEGRATATEVQEFYNSDAGLPHLPAGGHLGADALDACRQVDPAYLLPERAAHGLMGVDVGNRLHVVIAVQDAEQRDRLRAVYIDSVRGFDELDPLMTRYDVGRCVIDANPETRKVKEFAARWKGRVWPAYYPNFADDQHSELCIWDGEERVVRINRTAALDAVVARVQQRRLVLPANARDLGAGVNRAGIGEYYQHMGSPIRVIEEDKRGNFVARYEQNGPDHFAHASAYLEVAADRRLTPKAAPHSVTRTSYWRS